MTPAEAKQQGTDAPALLAAAREKAQRLLDQLIKEQAAMEQDPAPRAGLTPQAMAEGRQALANAIAAARRALAAIEAAAAVMPND